MDYSRIYDELITFRKTNLAIGYSEKHHIQMRSLGGSDDECNLVRLTAREHYVAHLLLARFNRCSQTAFALWMMQCKSSTNDNRPCIKSSRMYEWARKEFIKYISKINSVKGERNSQHGTRWICNIDLKENQKISKTDELPQGWILGRNKWNVKPLKGRNFVWANDGKTSIQVRGDTELPLGFQLGMFQSDEFVHHMKHSKLGNRSLKNRIWINDGSLNKTIFKNEMIPKGFSLGRFKKASVA